jgi:D-glycero-alpha-D-manno-heptose 1-phosphate guanylyltransferase
MKEAIILAGGLGTRLRAALPDLPKCMAPVGGKPFISHLVDHFRFRGVERFILSLGYKHEIIEEYFTAHYPDADVQFSIEQEPLGTGGAVRLACRKATAGSVLVLNGDTYFGVDPDGLAELHGQKNAHCTLSLKPMKDFDRYGVVILDKDQVVSSFEEKRHYSSGLINGGVYMLRRESFLQEDLPEKFSFESDYLERFCGRRSFYGFIQDSYFIDIGIPDDYRRAETELFLNL